MDSNYDILYDHEVDTWMGHTWKKYYFYYDKKDSSIHEYGGRIITRREMQQKCGRDLIKLAVPSEATVDNIYYRGNGLIHVNYHIIEKNGDIERGHINWELGAKRFIDDWGESTDTPQCEGLYLKALCPEIVIYDVGDSKNTKKTTN